MQIQSHFCKELSFHRIILHSCVCTRSFLHRVTFAQNNFLKSHLCKDDCVNTKSFLQSFPCKVFSQTSIHPCMFKGYPLWIALWVEKILSRVKSVLRGPYRNETLRRQKYVRRTLWGYAKQFLCKLASEQGGS